MALLVKLSKKDLDTIDIWQIYSPEFKDVTVYDYYIGVPVTDAGIMTLQLVLFFAACVVALIAHLKHKKHDT